MMTPNRRLRQARELRGWSQAKVAEQIGTDATTVSRWERGLFSPTPYFRERLCALFDKNAEELGLLETASQLRQHSVAVSEPLTTLLAQQEQAAVRITEPLYAEGGTPIGPPSWPERTDTFTYILQSLAHDEQAHMLWENAYVRVLQGEFTQAQQLGEASLNAFQQVGHMNATVLREWLNQRGLASSQSAATNTQPTSRSTSEKSRRVSRRFGFGKGIALLLLLLIVSTLISFRLSFGQTHQTDVSPPHPIAEHDYSQPRLLPSATTSAHPSPTPIPPPLAIAPSPTSTWPAVSMNITPTRLTPQNCMVDSSSYRCTLTLWLFARDQGTFSWQASSKDVLAQFNPPDGTLQSGHSFQIIVYLYSSPGKQGELIFSCTASAQTYWNTVIWAG